MATSCLSRVPQLGAELSRASTLTHRGHSCPCPHHGGLKSPQEGADSRPSTGWPGLGAPLPALCPSGCKAAPCQPTPGWWQSQGAADVGSAPNRSSWLLPKAVGRHPGPALPPAAAAPRPALTEEPARLLGPERWVRAGGAWAPHCPQHQECCQSEGQPRTVLASPQPQGRDLPEVHSAPLCCRGMLGSLGSSGPTAQWEPHHNPLTVQPHAGAQTGVCSCSGVSLAPASGPVPGTSSAGAGRRAGRSCAQ